jgi:hypothetical protein
MEALGITKDKKYLQHPMSNTTNNFRIRPNTASGMKKKQI